MPCYANRTTDITIGVATMIVNVFGNPTGCAAYVTICIAGVVINMLCYANRATNITIGVASVIVNVIGNPTGCTAYVTIGIALVIISVVNDRDDLLLNDSLTAILALFTFGQAGIDTVCIFTGQSDCVFVCASCFANKATYVTGSIVFVIVNVICYANCTASIAITITSVIINMFCYTRITASITDSITSIIIKVTVNHTNLAAGITIFITCVVVNMFCYARITASVTDSITRVVISMLCCTSIIASRNITRCITRIAPLVSCCRNRIDFFFTASRANACFFAILSTGCLFGYFPITKSMIMNRHNRLSCNQSVVSSSFTGEIIVKRYDFILVLFVLV